MKTTTIRIYLGLVQQCLFTCFNLLKLYSEQHHVIWLFSVALNITLHYIRHKRTNNIGPLSSKRVQWATLSDVETCPRYWLALLFCSSPIEAYQRLCQEGAPVRPYPEGDPVIVGGRVPYPQGPKDYDPALNGRRVNGNGHPYPQPPVNGDGHRRPVNGNGHKIPTQYDYGEWGSVEQEQNGGYTCDMYSMKAL